MEKKKEEAKVIEIKFEPFEILHPSQRKKSQAYLVSKLRDAVFNWRDQGYPNTTKTTKRLLELWFKEDHIIEGKDFKFWFAQREAIETLIYIYEVMRKRRFVGMMQDFGEGKVIYNPKADLYPLYCFKMATGTGKTFVMALSVVWSYFNYKLEGLDDYTNKFLLIAPNVIVYERLKRDFRDGKVFREFPFIPREWLPLFDLRIVLREDPVPNQEENIFFLTNIQQLEERRTRRKKLEKEIEESLGLAGAKRANIYQENRIREVLERFPNIMILKDEAHHIYSVEKAWKKILLNLHKTLEANHGRGLNAELDFTATPRTAEGALFPWVIVDFNLKEAIEMGIVKYPLKGLIKQPRLFESRKASEKFRRWIDASIKRWGEYQKSLSKLGKKSVLFVQCPKNSEADDVYDYICSLPHIRKERVLLIHTDSTGEIRKSELPALREKAKSIDEAESEIEIIISTMMLNEGWDVKSVNIILGLRSYGSPRGILPEQVIGRGLRRAFPEHKPDIRNCINTLEIIGPPALLEVIDQLEKEEGIKIGEVDISKPPPDITIYVDENKLKRNIQVPFLEPKYLRAELKFTTKDFKDLPKAKILFENKVLKETITYIAKDYLKGITMVERKWNLPVPKDTSSVIGYYTEQIRKELKIPKSFAEFYPLVEQYVQEKLFNKKIRLGAKKSKVENLKVLYNLIRPEVKEKLTQIFKDYFKNKLFTVREVGSFFYRNFSDIKPFIWTKLTYPAEKCVFNLCPCDNNLEMNFAKFLEQAEDVDSFTKNEGIGFFIEYVSSEKLLRNYKPDFIIRLKNNEHWIVETKGLVGIDVPFKDKRAEEWCRDTSDLTAIKWRFLRLDQKLFEDYRDRVNFFRDFINLISKTKT